MPSLLDHFYQLDSLQFTVPITLDYLATLLWAITGALIAGRRGYDFAGACGLALISATGGGLLRDGIFIQNGPPVLVRTPAYLVIVLIAVLLVRIFGTRILNLPRYNLATQIMDAFGIGLYAVVGMQAAKFAGLSLLGMALVGIVNGVGGGLLRDIVLGRDPEVFMPGAWFATAITAGCVLYIIMTVTFGLGDYVSAWATIFFIFALRMTALYGKMHSRPLIHTEMLE